MVCIPGANTHILFEIVTTLPLANYNKKLANLFRFVIPLVFLGVNSPGGLVTYPQSKMLPAILQCHTAMPY